MNVVILFIKSQVLVVDGVYVQFSIGLYQWDY